MAPETEVPIAGDDGSLAEPDAPGDNGDGLGGGAIPTTSETGDEVEEGSDGLGGGDLGESFDSAGLESGSDGFGDGSAGAGEEHLGSEAMDGLGGGVFADSAGFGGGSTALTEP